MDEEIEKCILIRFCTSGRMELSSVVPFRRIQSIFGDRRGCHSLASWLLHVIKRGFRQSPSKAFDYIDLRSLSSERRESNSDLCAWARHMKLALDFAPSRWVRLQITPRPAPSTEPRKHPSERNEGTLIVSYSLNCENALSSRKHARYSQFIR
jgi:hypothetical protein